MFSQRLQPVSTYARGNAEALLRGRNGDYRYGPAASKPPISQHGFAQSSKAARKAPSSNGSVKS